MTDTTRSEPGVVVGTGGSGPSREIRSSKAECTNASDTSKIDGSKIDGSKVDASNAGDSPKNSPKTASNSAGLTKPANDSTNGANHSVETNDESFNIEVNSTVMQGRRTTQEDRHIIVKDLRTVATALRSNLNHLPTPLALLAVFDGHQGSGCSDWIAKRFVIKLVPALARLKKVWSDVELKKCLSDVFLQLDSDFLTKFRSLPDGATAVVSLVIGQKLVTAWLGDSRCVMQTASGEPVGISEDHKPENEEETKRIIAAGGKVIKLGSCFRVAALDFEEKTLRIKKLKQQGGGQQEREPVALAVARSFGDREFKIPNPLLTAQPDIDIRKIEVGSGILLSCDGVFDVMTNEDTVERLIQAYPDAKKACSNIVNEAYKRESCDNLTCIVAYFTAPEIPSAPQSNGPVEEPSVQPSGQCAAHANGAKKVEKVQDKVPNEQSKDDRQTQFSNPPTAQKRTSADGPLSDLQNEPPTKKQK